MPGIDVTWSVPGIPFPCTLHLSRLYFSIGESLLPPSKKPNPGIPDKALRSMPGNFLLRSHPSFAFPNNPLTASTALPPTSLAPFKALVPTSFTCSVSVGVSLASDSVFSLLAFLVNGPATNSFCSVPISFFKSFLYSFIFLVIDNLSSAISAASF